MTHSTSLTSWTKRLRPNKGAQQRIGSSKSLRTTQAGIPFLPEGSIPERGQLQESEIDDGIFLIARIRPTMLRRLP